VRTALDSSVLLRLSRKQPGWVRYAMNIEHRTLNIERRMKEREVKSSQGEVISESPAHAGTMRSDSLRTLSSHGLGGSESTTP
jgi:hypothetical protein